MTDEKNQTNKSVPMALQYAICFSSLICLFYVGGAFDSWIYKDWQPLTFQQKMEIKQGIFDRYPEILERRKQLEERKRITPEQAGSFRENILKADPDLRRKVERYEAYKERRAEQNKPFKIFIISYSILLFLPFLFLIWKYRPSARQVEADKSDSDIALQ